MRIALASVALAMLVSLSGCEYREIVGRTGEISGCDGSACTTPNDCSSFQIPSGDCTLSQGACNFAQDCPTLNSSCNLTTRRCFQASDVCVGTPCAFNDDCPPAERCNQAAGVCYNFNQDQTCMPCFLRDSDCGMQSCDTNIDQCK